MPLDRARALAVAGALFALSACNATPVASPTGAQNPASRAPVTPRETAKPLWPAPANPMERTVAAGLTPETIEHLDFHVHAHLDIYLDGTPVLVPAGIGINITDPGVFPFAEADGSISYGGIRAPCATPCISPLHTHWNVGVIHTESATTTPNTLGQLFTEWDVDLSETCVGEYCAPAQKIAFYINGEPHTGDPAAIELADRIEIAIVIGTPPAQIPVTGDFESN
jgi:hypothetical protein